MFKNISKLGAVLNKAEQQSIKGGLNLSDCIQKYRGLVTEFANNHEQSPNDNPEYMETFMALVENNCYN